MTQPEAPAGAGHGIKIPLLLCVLLGFLLSYLVFFLWPVFFWPNGSDFAPAIREAPALGLDLRLTLNYTRSLIISHESPYTGHYLYPPVASILFVPLVLIGKMAAYRLVLAATVLCFGWMVFGFGAEGPGWRRFSALTLLFFVTGLFSYGLRFEMERGQFNVIAVSLALAAVWLFHRRPRLRGLAYILFTFSVQLKLFPILFILMLIDDWHSWKPNLVRLAGLSLANLALFFALGLRTFMEFVRAIGPLTAVPPVWAGNHSIRSFILWVQQFVPSVDGSNSPGYLNTLQGMLVVITVACIGITLAQAWRRDDRSINPHLLLACTLGALLLPSVSHDYTLTLLAAPTCLLLLREPSYFQADAASLTRAALVFAISVAYSSTLFSYANKLSWLANNLPALFMMLLATTVLSLLPGAADEPAPCSAVAMQTTR